MLNNRMFYHGHDLISTSEGPTTIPHGKNLKITIQWCSLKYSFKTVYQAFVERYKILVTFVVETCLFLKACFLSCLFLKLLTFFGMWLLLQLWHFD